MCQCGLLLAVETFDKVSAFSSDRRKLNKSCRFSVFWQCLEDVAMSEILTEVLYVFIYWQALVFESIVHVLSLIHPLRPSASIKNHPSLLKPPKFVTV